MPMYVVELKLFGNKHEDPPALRGQPASMGPITDHVERTFAAHGTSFATCMSDLQARLSAYVAVEEKLLNPVVPE